MSRRVMICCAVTGSADTPRKNPAVPVTPEAIARSAIDAAKAGAAVVHIHVRDPATGKPSMELALYREVVERIRESGVEVIINLTTGAGGRFAPGTDDPRQPGPGTTLSRPADRVRHIQALRPDICSLDMGSMNMGEMIFANTPAHLAEMAAAALGTGVVPELEVFEAGHVLLAKSMLEKKQLLPPAPVVRLMITSTPLSRMRSTTSRYSASSMLGLPVAGSRTWIWTTAAPALAASIAERAMASGVTGTAGFLRGVSALPVTAQQIMTRRDIGYSSSG